MKPPKRLFRRDPRRRPPPPPRRAVPPPPPSPDVVPFVAPEMEVERYRQESGMVMTPHGLMFRVWGRRRSTSSVFAEIFRDPRRPIDRAFFESMPPYGVNVLRPMSWRTFLKAVEELRGMGIIVGDRVAPGLVEGWEKAWHRDWLESKAEGGEE